VTVTVSGSYVFECNE